MGGVWRKEFSKGACIEQVHPWVCRNKLGRVFPDAADPGSRDLLCGALKRGALGGLLIAPGARASYREGGVGLEGQETSWCRGSSWRELAAALPEFQNSGSYPQNR